MHTDDMSDTSSCRGSCIRGGGGSCPNEVRCSLQPCLNHPVCREYGLQPQWILDCNNGVCMTCTAHFRGELVFVYGMRQCPLCNKQKNGTHVQMQCSEKHSVCIQCFSHPWDPSVLGTEPTPQQFACEPFSESLADAEHNEVLLETWKQNLPHHYQKYKKELHGFTYARAESLRDAKQALLHCPSCGGASPWTSEE
jgi:hypothetical protein